MKRIVVAAALFGLCSLPALAREPSQAKARDSGPVTLTDQQLDQVSAGELLGLNLNLSALGLNTNLGASVSGTNAGLLGNLTGLLGNTLNGTTQNGAPLGGLLNTATGLLGNLGL